MEMLRSKELFRIIENTLNEIDYRLVTHGQRVAYIVKEIMDYKGYDKETIKKMTMLSLLHDIGAYKTEDIDLMLTFEADHIWKHSIYGYVFLKYLSPLEEYSQIVLFHHHVATKNLKWPYLTWLLIMADRIDAYIRDKQEESSIDELITLLKQKHIPKEIIEDFTYLSRKKQLLHKIFVDHLENKLYQTLSFTKDEILSYLTMISYSIDFQSRHMVAHTITTTTIAVKLAQLLKLNETKQDTIRYAALLHDIGKVSTPVAILEKPGKLNEEEMQIMKKHIMHTIHILEHNIDPHIFQIASRHHEKLNGTGYPYGLTKESLTLEDRILAVADIFSALFGKRSYKDAYDKQQLLYILKAMADNNEIDAAIVAICNNHYDEIVETIQTECAPTLSVYNHITIEYENLLKEFGACEK